MFQVEPTWKPWLPADRDLGTASDETMLLWDSRLHADVFRRLWQMVKARSDVDTKGFYWRGYLSVR